MIDLIVTVILGPIAAFGLIWALLSGRKLQKSALAYRLALAMGAAGLLVQLFIYADPDGFGHWWVLKDLALILLGVEVVRYQFRA